MSQLPDPRAALEARLETATHKFMQTGGWNERWHDLLFGFAKELAAALASSDPPAVRQSPIIKDMQRASALIDTADGVTEYTTRCVALALIVRQFLRERDAT